MIVKIINLFKKFLGIKKIKIPITYKFYNRIGEYWGFNFNGRGIHARICHSHFDRKYTIHCIYVIRGNEYHRVGKRYHVSEKEMWDKKKFKHFRIN